MAGQSVQSADDRNHLPEIPAGGLTFAEGWQHQTVALETEPLAGSSDVVPADTQVARATNESKVPRWATPLACAVIGLLVPTGFSPELVYWNLALLAGGSYALYRMATDVWPFAPIDTLSLCLLANAVVASVQLVAGNTASPFLTLGGLQFWSGSLLLLPLLRDGVASRIRCGNGATTMHLLILGLFVASLAVGTHGTFGADAADGAPLWWPFVYRNHLAGLVVLTLPILLWRIVEEGEVRWVALGAAVTGIASVVAAGSRAGVALMLCEMLVVGVFLTKQRKPMRRIAAAGVFAAILAVAVGLGGTSVLQFRIAQASPLLEGRVDYWRASVEMIAERPFTGWGFGTWPDVYRQFQVYDSGLIVNRAHSDWLEWTAEGGVVSGLALVALLIAAIRLALRHPWAWGLPMLLLYGAVDYTLRQPLIWATFLMVWLAATHSGGQGRDLRQKTLFQSRSSLALERH